MAASARSTTVASGDVAAPSIPAGNASSWDRLSAWYGENKVVAWTVAGVTVIAAGGTIYYLSRPPTAASPEGAGEKKKGKRKSKKKDGDRAAEEGKAASTGAASTGKAKAASVAEEEVDELPNVTEDSVAQLSEQQRKEYAARLKAAGNKAYGSKDYNRAIALYGQAILCRADPVFYSNRAACWNAMSNWPKVIEDTTAAINLDSEYVKALNRRANAFEQEGRCSEALLDYTASCIIDQFKTESSTEAVERLLKKVAEAKAKTILGGKEKRLPSPTFVSNYLQSFRQKDLPGGLEETVDLEEGSGRWFLRKGLQAIQLRTAEGYNEAAQSFEQAIAKGHLDEHEAMAHNMRGTFRYLKGDNEGALTDLNKSIELGPSLVQSYVKRASMHLEQSTLILLNT